MAPPSRSRKILCDQSLNTVCCTASKNTAVLLDHANRLFHKDKNVCLDLHCIVVELHQMGLLLTGLYRKLYIHFKAHKVLHMLLCFFLCFFSSVSFLFNILRLHRKANKIFLKQRDVPYSNSSSHTFELPNFCPTIFALNIQ